jgi:hypothetical protein
VGENDNDPYGELQTARSRRITDRVVFLRDGRMVD